MTVLASTLSSKEGPDNWLVYDGECPFCSAYVELLRLRESVGPLPLINAREGGREVAEIAAAGLDLDEGMVLKISGHLYHGNDCVHALAMLSQPKGLFNYLNIWVFRSEARSRILYPVLRAARNLLLRVLGRKKLAIA